MRSKLRSLFYFLLAASAVVITLKALNWLPRVIQKDTMREYKSIEEVRSVLNIRDLFIPAYYPQSISWPPSRILAQAKPYPAVVMVYNRAGTGDTVLIISQAVSKEFSLDRELAITKINERVPYRLHDRNAFLEVGSCKNGETCSRIFWEEGRYHITAAMKSSPFELIKIAESMLR